ncbi:DNA-binding protein [Variovorax sp. LjRoot175]|uniref:DNA-binding protein n=1 Tax=Variovorax sp. LjRoot175 TaxID=3342276 RepID=UPI003ED0087D
MLERWFATLGERLVGSTAGSASGRPAGNGPDGMPMGVRNAARLLWETARREAEEVQRGELESVRAELQAREDALAEAQTVLTQREEAFAQARASLMRRWPPRNRLVKPWNCSSRSTRSRHTGCASGWTTTSSG